MGNRIYIIFLKGGKRFDRSVKLALLLQNMGKTTYNFRKNNGLCVCCGERMDRKGVYCQICNQKRAEKEKEKRTERKEQGLCVLCGSPVDSDSFCCQKCLNRDNESKRKRYQKNAENGICTACGKNPAETGKKKCRECLDKINKNASENKAYYISIGICPICKKNMIFKNEKSCPECKAAMAERQVKKYRSNIENGRKTAMKSYFKCREERLKAGLCVKCGKRVPETGKKNCNYCLGKQKKYNRTEREKKGITPIAEHRSQPEQGKCWFCGEPVKEGYRVCEKCYQRCVKNATCENANEAREEMQKKGILY